jgi:uncharacterized protein
MTTRYTQVPFPAYRHFPGKTTHPDRDPVGHAMEKPDPVPHSLIEVPWQNSQSYLYGIDLFNAGYWWECHEILEGLWLATGRKTRAGHTMQAIIQCAAAHLKIALDQPIGARRLITHCDRHVKEAGPYCLGVNLETLQLATEAFVMGDQGTAATIKLTADNLQGGNSLKNSV